MKQPRFLFTLALMVTFLAGMAGTANALPTISLGSDEGSYVGDDPDAWINDSWVVYDTDFELSLLLSNPSGSAELYLSDLTLIISIPEADFGSAWATIDGNPLAFTEYGIPPGEPGHGVFPTYYATYLLGDYVLSPSSSIILTYQILWGGTDMIHFDATATHVGHYLAGEDTEHIHFNPPSHDLTAVPEPAVVLLLGMGLLALGAWRRFQAS